MPHSVQSSGGDWMPRILPGSSSASPKSQSFSYGPIEMQFTNRAMTLRPAGSLSKRTGAPISSGRLKRAAHSWGFTKITKHAPEKRLGQMRSRESNKDLARNSSASVLASFLTGGTHTRV